MLRELEAILTETFKLVKADGTVVEDIRTPPIAEGTCVAFRPEVHFEEGDLLERDLPSGRTDQYEILDVSFFSEIHGVPAHYQLAVRNVRKRVTAPAPATVTYNLHGANSRVNHHSTDLSNNVVNTGTGASDLLDQVETALVDVVQDAHALRELRAQLAVMRATHGQPAFTAHYAQFMVLAANYLGALTPMLPALSNLLVQAP